MKPFRTCLRGLRATLDPFRWRIWVSVLIGIVTVAASLGFVWTSKKVVDIATGVSADPLRTYVILLLCIMLLQVLCRVAARYWEGLTVVLAQNRTRSAVFGVVMNSTWTGKEKFHSGDTVSRLEEDIRVVCDFLCVTLPDFIITVTQLLAASAYLVFLAPDMAWILLIIMPVAVVCSRLFFKKLRSLTGDIRQIEGSIQGHIQENLQHRVLVKTLTRTAQVISDLGALQLKAKDKTVERLGYNAISRGFMQLGFAAGYALVFLWGVFGIRDGVVTYGTMVAFLQLVGQVQRPVAGIASQIPAFIRALASEDRLEDLTGLEQENIQQPVLLPGAPGVLIEGVSFAYEGCGEQVFTTLDYDFKPGSTTLIVGRTGAGKSTLARIILALLKPSEGKVTLYSGNESHETCEALRCNFMYVPQGNSLMSGTVRENLLLARADASEEELKDALHLAAADFVFDLPQGLDTVCAEVGSGLSEGQAQRVAIARALLRRGGILIMDEATSALDEQTEAELLHRISERFRGSKTIICITHRTAAAQYADATLRM